MNKSELNYKCEGCGKSVQYIYSENTPVRVVCAKCESINFSSLEDLPDAFDTEVMLSMCSEAYALAFGFDFGEP